MKNFRNVIIIVMVLAMVFSFTACAKSGTDASDPTGETEHHIVGIYTDPTDSNDHGEEITTPDPVEEATQPSGEVVTPTENSTPDNSTAPSNSSAGTGSNNSGSNNTGSTGSNNSGSNNNGSGNTGNSGSTTPTNPQPTEPKPSNPQPTTPSHTHSYTKVVTKPTCTTDGYTTYTCSCGDSYKADTTKATGHSYSVSSKVDPTCTSEGKATYKCSTCNDTYFETLAKSSHDWEHHHTDEVSHQVRYLICRCGWECSENDVIGSGYPDIYNYYEEVHITQVLRETGTSAGHSYRSERRTVIDTPAKDWWTCRNCGSETTSKP